jgi:hypothetical protein
VNTNRHKETNMDAPSFITDIARRRVDIVTEDDGPSYNRAYARREAILAALESRGTSAVAREELRLLDEFCMSLDAEHDAEQAAEIAAEYAWLRAAEAPTADDYAFERYEAEMGLVG